MLYIAEIIRVIDARLTIIYVLVSIAFAFAEALYWLLDILIAFTLSWGCIYNII